VRRAPLLCHEENTLDQEEFIETQSAFQFGECRAEAKPSLRELAAHLAQNRRFLAYHDPVDRSFVPPERGLDLRYDPGNGWRRHLRREERRGNEAIRAGRYADQLNDLYDGGLRSPVLIDMKDAILDSNDEFPCFQYVRRPGAINSILWPLRRVHNLGSTEFCGPPDPQECPFRDKKPVVFWRGIIRGFSTHGGKRTNIKSILKGYLEKTISHDLLLAHLQTVPRYKFVSKYFGRPGFDVGFTEEKDRQPFRKVEDVEKYRKPSVTHADHLGCKYQISIGGTDVSTSFGWQISTNCMLLKEDYPWEVFFECHFQPNQDYLLVESDFSGIEEKVAWCEDNPEACQAMIESRHRVVPLLVDAEISREVKRRVVRRYEDFYERHHP